LDHHPRQSHQRREQPGFPYRQLNESSGKIFGGAMQTSPSGKELAQSLFNLLWTHPLAQDTIPGAGVWHRLSLQLEQASQFLL
jgi:hypothetical protein